MKSEKPETVKVKTDEKKESTTNQDLKDELTTKGGQLKNNKLRLEGGYFEAAQRTVKSIDQEIKEVDRVVEMQTIQIAEDAPERPEFMFQRNDRWRQLNKEGLTEVRDGNKKTLEKLKTQKEEMIKSIPELQTRINVLEEKLGEKKTDFKKDKADYIG